MASDQRDPDALRVHFGEELRRMRMRAKLSQSQLASALGCTPQWICQLEKADKTVSEQTALDLDTHFKTDGWEHEEGHFLRIYTTIRRAGRHRALLPGFDAYLHHESRAIGIRCFAAQVVPGLLQTESYARGLMMPGESAETLETRVTGRMERQAILTRQNPPMTIFVLDESVLHRPVGGSKAMAEQLDHLIGLEQSLHVDLRVLPYGRVSPAGLEGSFILLSFVQDVDLMYIEAAGVSQLIEGRSTTFKAGVRFSLVMGESLSCTETFELLNRVREEYS
ncbi:helix-turn-helix transcriptional regulator [Actinomadura sp. B10D3]|uniref:helix-turn-helix domain-containing protein n=1 Tax=Actinomadura sp. B10D3 TaxID=3153557 RepID=UPI00325E49FE